MPTETELKHLPIAGPMPQTPEWKAMRLANPDREIPVSFGASQAAASLNVSRYSSALELYLEMRGERPVDDLSENEAVQAGIILEPAILRLYQIRELNLAEENLIHQLPSFRHPIHSFMSCTPDAIVADQEMNWLRGVDAKATSYRSFDESGDDDSKFGEPGTDQIPLDYFLQAQQQCAVLGVLRVDFPVLFDGRRLRTYTVDRNEDFIRQIVKAEAELAQRILDGCPPEPNWEMSGTKGLIDDFYGCRVSLGRTVELDSADEEMWQDQEVDRMLAQEVEKRMDVRKNCLLWKLGDAQFGKFPGSGARLHRIIVKDGLWTDKDVVEAQKKLGEIKRRGHSRLLLGDCRENSHSLER